MICVHGTVRQGNPCWRVETAKGTWNLVGNLAGTRDGDEVYVCGVEATAAFCGAGAALAVSWIGTTMGGGAALPLVVQRDVEVVVTRSTRDNSPTFKLEEQPLTLAAAGGKWQGSFAGIPVHGPLDIFFLSDGWIDQEFTLTVNARDPQDATKTWTKTYTKVVKKSHVAFDEDLDVGAAMTKPGPVASPIAVNPASWSNT